MNSDSTGVVQKSLDGPGATTVLPDEFILEGLQVQRQQRDRWCWAAVSASLNEFYNQIAGAPFGQSWSQCELAAERLRLQGIPSVDCCNGRNRSQCDRVHRLSKALHIVGKPHYYFERPAATIEPRSLTYVKRQIFNKRTPVVARVKRGELEGSRDPIHHFVIIGGFKRMSFTVFDPGGNGGAEYVRPMDIAAGTWTRRMGKWAGSYFKEGSIDGYSP